jgi:hypothetical protein
VVPPGGLLLQVLLPLLTRTQRATIHASHKPHLQEFLRLVAVKGHRLRGGHFVALSDYVRQDVACEHTKTNVR